MHACTSRLKLQLILHIIIYVAIISSMPVLITYCESKEKLFRARCTMSSSCHNTKLQSALYVLNSTQFYVLQFPNSHQLHMFILINMLLISGAATSVHLLLTFPARHNSTFAILDPILQASVA